MGLGKILKEIILSPRQRQAAICAAASPISFNISDARLDTIFESDKSKFKEIGLREGKMCYFYYGVISSSEKAAIESAKTAIMKSFIENTPITDRNLFEQVYLKAKAEISHAFASGKTDHLAYMLAHDMAGYGPISMLLEDSSDIEEIEINSPFSIAVYHRRYGRCNTNLIFNSKEDFRYTINRMAAECGKELGEVTPILDFQIGNARVHAQLLGDSSLASAVATIRIGGHYGFDAETLSKSRFAGKEVFTYISSCIASGKNIVICGAPGTGKTTLLTAISSFLPKDKRVIVIEEEINEIKLDAEITNSVTLVSSEAKGIGFREQIKNALHMRPEFIIVGEIRGQEANDAFSGANIGIPFITTMHSSGNGGLLLSRLSANPMHLEPWLVSNLDVSIFLSKDANGIRRIESIVEYLWDKNEVKAEKWVVKNGLISAPVQQQSPGALVYASPPETAISTRRSAKKILSNK
jgi:flagellar protein FlaI